jgi:hypothetical protein
MAATATAPAATAGTQLSIADMWAMYLDGLNRGSGLPSPQGLMLAGTSLPAQLNTETVSVPPISPEQALFQIFSLGDNLPEWKSETSGNTGLFYTRSVVDLFNQYAAFLNSIKLQGDPDPAVQALVRARRAELDAALTRYTETFTKAFDAFQKTPPGMYKDWEDFLKRTPYGGILAQENAAVQNAQTALDQALRQAFGAQAEQLALAMNQVRAVQSQMATGQGSLIMQVKNDVNKAFPVPSFLPSLLGQGGGAGYSAWLDQAILAAAQKQPPEVQIAIRQGSSQFDMSQMTFAFGGKVSYFPFVWFEASGSYTEVKVDTASSEFSIEITMQSVTQVTLQPGQWYMGSMVANFTQPGDFLADSPFAQKPIWGPGGLFNTQLTGIVVAFRPGVRASFDRDSYQRLRQDWTASGSLRVGVGPFFLGVGGGASGSKEDIVWDDAAYTISFTDKTLVPKIIGVRVAAPNFP